MQDKQTLLGTMSIINYTHCSDDRDLLFSPLSLAPDLTSLRDYSVSTNEMFVKFAQRLIQYGHTLVALRVASFQKNERPRKDQTSPQNDHLPSWTPDLRAHIGRIWIHRLEFSDAVLTFSLTFTAGTGTLHADEISRRPST